jgi:hypothetical protein
MRLTSNVRPLMLDFYIVPPDEEFWQRNGTSLPCSASLDEGMLSFLRPYIHEANLDPDDSSFLAIYSDTVLHREQLHRMATVLKEALLDLSARPTRFEVLYSLPNAHDRLAEAWRLVDRAQLEFEVRALLRSIEKVIDLGGSMFAYGD